MRKNRSKGHCDALNANISFPQNGIYKTILEITMRKERTVNFIGWVVVSFKTQFAGTNMRLMKVVKQQAMKSLNVRLVEIQFSPDM